MINISSKANKDPGCFERIVATRKREEYDLIRSGQVSPFVNAFPRANAIGPGSREVEALGLCELELREVVESWDNVPAIAQDA